jgi:hypothetical protein
MLLHGSIRRVKEFISNYITLRARYEFSYAHKDPKLNFLQLIESETKRIYAFITRVYMYLFWILIDGDPRRIVAMQK